MKALVTKKFIEPSFKPELGEDGLTLHEIAESIGAEFFHVKQKFEKIKDKLRVSAIEISMPNDSNGLQTCSYLMATDDAKLFITQYRNDVAVSYCRFLIDREKQLIKVEKSLDRISPSMRALLELEFQQIKLQDEQKRVAQEQSKAAFALAQTQSDVKQLQTTSSESPLTVVQQQEILKHVEEAAIKAFGNNKKGSGQVLKRLKRFFNLNPTRQTYKDLKQSDFNMALEFLKTLGDI